MRKLFLLLLITVLFGCVSTNKEVLLEELEIIEDLNANDQEIYTFLLKVLLQNHPQHLDRDKSDISSGKIVYIDTKTIVLNNHTSLFLDQYMTYSNNIVGKSDYIKRIFPEISDDLLENFSIRNKNHIKLETLIENLDFVVDYSSIENEINSSDPGEYWNSFYSLLPETAGEVTFSAIGYNLEHNEAFIDVEFISGSMSGNITYLYLEKNNDVWKVVAADTHLNY